MSLPPVAATSTLEDPRPASAGPSSLPAIPSLRPESTPEALPFIKWVGGKRKLVPELIRRAPKHFGTYHEPFTGGAALFFGLASARGLSDRPPDHRWAVLSDTNLRLVRSFRAVRDDVEGLVGRLRDYAESHSEEQYYEVRALDVDGFEHDADVAAWFIYLNKTGFNGLYRVNRKGGFNVPMGRYENPNICDDRGLRAASRALQGAEIRHEGFEAVLGRAAPGDFVYFDPPYVPLSTTASFTAYTEGGFDLADQERLRDVARALKERGVHVLLSNSDTPRVRSLYHRGFSQGQVMMGRAINAKTSARGAVAELLIS